MTLKKLAKNCLGTLKSRLVTIIGQLQTLNCLSSASTWACRIVCLLWKLRCLLLSQISSWEPIIQKIKLGYLSIFSIYFFFTKVWRPKSWGLYPRDFSATVRLCLFRDFFYNKSEFPRNFLLNAPPPHQRYVAEQSGEDLLLQGFHGKNTNPYRCSNPPFNLFLCSQTSNLERVWMAWQ